jgi:hypothetical protein
MAVLYSNGNKAKFQSLLLDEQESACTVRSLWSVTNSLLNGSEACHVDNRLWVLRVAMTRKIKRQRWALLIGVPIFR